MAGSTSILCLGRETFETMRMKRQEVDQALLFAEDYIDKQGVPQIDFVMINENSDAYHQLNNGENALSAQHQKQFASKEIISKFKRAIRRLVLLARAARGQGNESFDIGGLMFEVTD